MAVSCGATKLAPSTGFLYSSSWAERVSPSAAGPVTCSTSAVWPRASGCAPAGHAACANAAMAGGSSPRRRSRPAASSSSKSAMLCTSTLASPSGQQRSPPSRPACHSRSLSGRLCAVVPSLGCSRSSGCSPSAVGWSCSIDSCTLHRCALHASPASPTDAPPAPLATAPSPKWPSSCATQRCARPHVGRGGAPSACCGDGGGVPRLPAAAASPKSARDLPVPL